MDIRGHFATGKGHEKGNEGRNEREAKGDGLPFREKKGKVVACRWRRRNGEETWKTAKERGDVAHPNNSTTNRSNRV